MDLQKEIDNLGCGAFIAVCFPVGKHDVLSFHVEDDEERMQPIDELLEEFNDKTDEDYLKLKGYEYKGVTEVVLIRGW